MKKDQRLPVFEYKIFPSLRKNFDTFCNLRLEATDFSLINYSQEKDLNNLVAARKHQKNPEKAMKLILNNIDYKCPLQKIFLLFQIFWSNSKSMERKVNELSTHKPILIT